MKKILVGLYTYLSIILHLYLVEK